MPTVGSPASRPASTIAERQLNWWLGNHVYPMTFAWQSGPSETLLDQVTDLSHRACRAGGSAFDLSSRSTAWWSGSAKSRLRWIWDEMKENSLLASEPLPRTFRRQPSEELPGASLVVAKLKEHLAQRPKKPTEVHLVGHSAGSVFLAGLLERLVDARIPVASLTYLAAAVRTDTWMDLVLPHLKSGAVQSFTSFGMDPVRELDDVCGGRGVVLYHKSLLYLVSKALERTQGGKQIEVPLVGMAHFAEAKVNGTTLVKAVDEVGGSLVWSPNASPSHSRSDAATHGGFDDDTATMTSVLLRILGQETVQPGNEYVPHLPSAATGALIESQPTALADQPPDIVMADVQGDASTASGGRGASQATTSSAAPRGTREGHGRSRVIAALEQDGWATS